MQADASDGFILVPHITPDGLGEFADKVVPILQERGVFRTDYEGSTLRDHLGPDQPRAGAPTVPLDRPASGGLMTVAEIADLVPDPAFGDPILDNAAWASLTGPHRRFAERRGAAARYLPDVAPFVALADSGDPRPGPTPPQLVGPGSVFAVAGPDSSRRPGWTDHGRGAGCRLVDVALQKAPIPEAVRLGPADVPEILDLVGRTQPGPFRRGRSNWAPTWASGAVARWWRWPASGCTPRAGPRSAQSAPILPTAAGPGHPAGRRGRRRYRRPRRPGLPACLGGEHVAIRLYVAMGFRLRLVTQFHAITAPSS